MLGIPSAKNVLPPGSPLALWLPSSAAQMSPSQRDFQPQFESPIPQIIIAPLFVRFVVAPKLEITPKSVSRCWDKLIVVSPDRGAVLSEEQEWTVNAPARMALHVGVLTLKADTRHPQREVHVT